MRHGMAWQNVWEIMGTRQDKPWDPWELGAPCIEVVFGGRTDPTVQLGRKPSICYQSTRWLEPAEKSRCTWQLIRIIQNAD